ncbi:MAG: hypothetical protein AAFO94_23345, partial [Bacteroidota bacterium]
MPSSNGCSAEDEITISINPLPVVELGNDTAICQNESILLDAGNTGADFSWSNGETTQTISVDAADTYSVTVTDANGCSAEDEITISINPLPVVELGNDTAICQNESILLDAGNTGADFSWSNGETTQTISVDADDTYSVTVTDANGC